MRLTLRQRYRMALGMAGITATELAQQFGVSVQTLSNIAGEHTTSGPVKTKLEEWIRKEFRKHNLYPDGMTITITKTDNSNQPHTGSH